MMNFKTIFALAILLQLSFLSSAQSVEEFGSDFFKVTLEGERSIQDIEDISVMNGYILDFTLEDNHTDRVGNKHFRYHSHINGMPIKAMHITSHYSVNSDKTSFYIPRNLPKSKTSIPKSYLPQEIMLKKAKNLASAASYTYADAPRYSSTKGLIMVPVHYNFKKAEWILAYEVDLISHDPHLSVRYTFDAVTGELITEENRLCTFHSTCTSTVPGTAVTKYHGTQEIETTQEGDIFVLRDQTRGTGITTFDLNTGGLFQDDDNFWDNANAAQDEVAGDVHWGSGATYDYFLQELFYDGLDGSGMGIESLVHLQIANAFWDGVNASYGDGEVGTDLDLPLTYINVVGHEMTHAVTEFSSGLIYSGESGGLNEGASDIMGTSVENFTNPGVVDWLIGEEVSSTGFYFRNMANPKDVGMSDTYLGEFFSEFNGPHTMSSIPNKWFTLLIEGGTGTNDNDFTYQVESIGWDKASLLMNNTWTNYLIPSSTYEQCALFTIEETASLYGACSFEVQQVKIAWEAVGVLSNQNAEDFSSSGTNFCELPAAVAFFSNPDATGHSWDFGDGNVSTEANPLHEYQAEGVYSVTLSGIDCDGEDFTTIKENYIFIDTLSTACDTITLTDDGVTQFSDLCLGTFVDDGGSDAQYGNSVFSEIVIEAPNAFGYDITFHEFVTEECCDELQLYIDVDGNWQLIEIFAGNLTDFSLTIAAPALRFIFITDETVTDQGFVISWNCIQANEPPTADFTVSNTILCQSEVQLINQSSITTSTWEWLLNGVLVSNDQNPWINLPMAGTYDVTLIACNNIGCDTLTQEDILVFDPELPTCDTLIMVNNSEIVTSECEGVIVDDGGPDGEYSDDIESSIIFDNPMIDAYEFTIEEFVTENCCDALYFFVWNGTDFVLFEELRGFENPQTITIPANRVQLVFATDGSVTESGFVIDYQCLIATEPPTAAIDAESTTDCFGTFNLFSESTGIVTLYEWYINGNLVSNEQNPEIFAPGGNGTYDITLIVCNSIGCDTLLIEDYLVVDSSDEECEEVSFDDTFYNISTCSGTLFDDGGESGEYSDNFYGGAILTSPNGEGYTITISGFETESGIDNLLIQEGESIASLNTIYNLSGNNVADFTFISLENVLVFTFDTDGSVTGDGFQIDYECIDLDGPPVATINSIVEDCSAEFTFLANSPNADSYSWDFGDGQTDVGAVVIHLYEEIGTYEVVMTATNSAGSTEVSSLVSSNFQPVLFNAPVEILINTDHTLNIYTHNASEISIINWYINDVYITDDLLLDLNFTDVSTNEIRVEIIDLDDCFSEYTRIIEAREVLLNVENEWNTAITMYPNPANASVTLGQLDQLDGAIDISIIDNVGRTLLVNSDIQNDTHTFSVNHLVPGMYFVKISNENREVFKKLTIID